MVVEHVREGTKVKKLEREEENVALKVLGTDTGTTHAEVLFVGMGKNIFLKVEVLFGRVFLALDKVAWSVSVGRNSV